MWPLPYATGAARCLLQVNSSTRPSYVHRYPHPHANAAHYIIPRLCRMPTGPAAAGRFQAFQAFSTVLLFVYRSMNPRRYVSGYLAVGL